MSETRYTIDQDLREAAAMAASLVPYVHEEPLYGKTGGGGFFGMSQMPSLTLGALLLRLRRLDALSGQLTTDQRMTLVDVHARHEAARHEWTLHYNSKLAQEAASRLKAMTTFFEEMRDTPRIAAQNYLPEALRRTIAHEVMAALPERSTDLDATARRIDTSLRRWTQPDTFLWDTALQPAYPQPTYWWLYVRPAVPTR